MPWNGISGDFPLILVRVGEGDELSLLGELLRAHECWRLKQLLVDFVILNEDAGGYAQGRQEQILALVRTSRGGALLNQRGGIFVLRGDLLPAGERTLLETVSCAILATRQGGLAQHLRSREPEAVRPAPAPQPPGERDAPLEPVDLRLSSPYGGFTADGQT